MMRGSTPFSTTREERRAKTSETARTAKKKSMGGDEAHGGWCINSFRVKKKRGGEEVARAHRGEGKVMRGAREKGEGRGPARGRPLRSS